VSLPVAAVLDDDHAADRHDHDRSPEDDVDNRLHQHHHHDRSRTVDHHGEATPRPSAHHHRRPALTAPAGWTTHPNDVTLRV
jgi:hypothetical protein